MKTEEISTRIREALGRIIDPETRLDVARMNLIHDISVGEDGLVSLTFKPSSPVCPMAYALANAIRKELLGIDGVASIRIKVENFNRASHLESLINDPGD